MYYNQQKNNQQPVIPLPSSLFIHTPYHYIAVQLECIIFHYAQFVSIRATLCHSIHDIANSITNIIYLISHIHDIDTNIINQQSYYAHHAHHTHVHLRYNLHARYYHRLHSILSLLYIHLDDHHHCHNLYRNIYSNININTIQHAYKHFHHKHTAQIPNIDANNRTRSNHEPSTIINANISFTYILFHWRSSYFYVGQTSQSLHTRLTQHINTAIRLQSLYNKYYEKHVHAQDNSNDIQALIDKIIPDKKYSMLYSYMATHDPYSFAIIPCTFQYGHQQSKQQRCMIERQLIIALQPKLNTVHNIHQNSHVANQTANNHPLSRKRKHSSKAHARRPAQHKRKKAKTKHMQQQHSISAEITNIHTQQHERIWQQLTISTHPQFITTYHTIIHGQYKQYYSLSELLQQPNIPPTNYHIPIVRIKGKYDITNWCTVYFIAHPSTITIHVPDITAINYNLPNVLPLMSMLSIIKRLKLVHFTLHIQKTIPYTITTKQLHHLILHPYSWQNILRSLPMSHLLHIITRAKQEFITNKQNNINDKHILNSNANVPGASTTEHTISNYSNTNCNTRNQYLYHYQYQFNVILQRIHYMFNDQVSWPHIYTIADHSTITLHAFHVYYYGATYYETADPSYSITY